MNSLSALERVETARLDCERLRMEHVAEVSLLLRDPRVTKWLWPRGQPPSEQEVIESTAEKERHWERYGFGLWLFRDKATGEMVGRGGLQWTYVAGMNEIEVGWAIVPERWGQGLATELAWAAIGAAFGPLGLHEVVAFTLPDNVASRRVMEKTGFEFERDIVHAGLPHVLYQRTASEGRPAPAEGPAAAPVTLPPQRSPFL